MPPTKHISPEWFNKYFMGGIYTDIPPKYKNNNAFTEKKRLFPNLPLTEPFKNVSLTYREVECLLLLRKGYTNVKVGEKLNLSPRTVEFYIKNMREKLGCYTKRHLIECLKHVELDRYLLTARFPK